MKVDELNGIKVDDFVRPMVGPYLGQPCKVLDIRKDEGAYYGWFTVELLPPYAPTQLLFAGQEIRKE